MIRASERDAIPRAVVDVVGGVEVRPAEVVGVERDVPEPVVVAQRRGPLALAVRGLAVPQREVVADVRPVEDVVDDLPVHEVVRLHDRSPGAQVHGRADHVVEVAALVVLGGGDALHRDIRHIGVQQGHAICPVAVVGGGVRRLRIPLLRGRGRVSDRQHARAHHCAGGDDGQQPSPRTARRIHRRGHPVTRHFSSFAGGDVGVTASHNVYCER